MGKDINPHNVVAVVQKGFSDVEIRYGDGKPPVLLKNTTTSKVLRDIEFLKLKEEE